jgi:outer membrane lipoprotein SlyB
MKRYMMILPVALLMVSACTTGEQNATVGALGGAAVGAAISSDNDRAKGALIGAAVGAVASQYIGRSNRSGLCIYEDSRGRRYEDRCPS